MYLITLSTPDRATTFVSSRTHKAIEKKYASSNDGKFLYFGGANGNKYIGYFSGGKLIKP